MADEAQEAAATDAPSVDDINALLLGPPPTVDDINRMMGASPGAAASVEDVSQMMSPSGGMGSVADFGQQFLAGINDVTAFLARPFEAVLPTPVIGPEGFEVLSPGETEQRRERGEIGIPGMATGEAETLAGRAGELGGQAVATAAAAAPALAAIPLAGAPATGAGIGTRAMTALRNLFPQAGRTIMASPKTSLAIEAGLGTTAGAGGFAAQQAFPDSDAARLVGEVVGGTAPALMPMSMGLRALRWARNRFSRFVAADPRVEERIRRAVPEDARAGLEAELDAPTTIDPATGEAVLTPAQRTQEPGLLALERAVMESTDELALQADDQIWHANRVIQESAEQIGTPTSAGGGAAAAEEMERVHQYLEHLMDTRVRQAATAVDQRVASLGPRATREQANQIAMEEIENALAAGRAQESQLYSIIPQDTPVRTTSTVDRYKQLLDDLGKPEKDDMPAVATRWLGEKSDDFLGSATTLKDLRSLASKLRSEARKLRSGDTPDWNGARLADSIADAVVEDVESIAGTLGAGPRLADGRPVFPGKPIAQAVEDAVDFSRRLNDRFSRGTVGKMLGKTGRGERRVKEGLTLEQSIGMSGPKAREAMDDLVKAFDSPESPGAATIIEASEDYLRGRFLEQAVRGGVLNETRAQTFLRNNEELLKRLPGVRQEIVAAMEAGGRHAREQIRRKGMKFENPKAAKTVMYLQKSPEEAFRSMVDLRPARAGREAQILLNTVKRDRTGEATEGLKASFRKWLMDSAASHDTQGHRIVSGFELRDMLELPAVEAMAKKILTQSERERLDIIVRDLSSLQKARAARLPHEGIIGDQPGRVLETVAGIGGAGLGRQLGRAMDSATIQIPGIMAARFREIARAGITDPAARLLTDAIQDETLFREVLLSPLKPDGTLPEPARRRLNAWAAAVLAEHGGVLLDEEADAEVDLLATSP